MSLSRKLIKHIKDSEEKEKFISYLKENKVGIYSMYETLDRRASEESSVDGE